VEGVGAGLGVKGHPLRVPKTTPPAWWVGPLTTALTLAIRLLVSFLLEVPRAPGGTGSRRVRTICGTRSHTPGWIEEGVQGRDDPDTGPEVPKTQALLHTPAGRRKNRPPSVLKKPNVQQRNFSLCLPMDPTPTAAVLPSPAATLAEDSGSDDYALSVKDESSDADEYEDWDSDAEGGLSAVCLFCDAAGPVPRTVSHLATEHGFVAGEWLRAGEGHSNFKSSSVLVGLVMY
jgi:hypothetical protein